MLRNGEGTRVPDVTFRVRREDEWQTVSSSEIFNGRTVVAFALPGAFTPTCSSSHVPRYDQLAGALHEQGIDEIVCISVNDPFVMHEWQQAQNAWNITFLPDGNGEFTSALGMLVDKSDLGFGPRSWRYSMLVRDGLIEKMFIEPEVAGDPFEVSDADTMLGYLAPDAAPVVDAVLLTRAGCPHCGRARRALRDAGIDFDELTLNQSLTDRAHRALTGRTTYPQVFVNGEHIGGADELLAWLSHRRKAA